MSDADPKPDSSAGDSPDDGGDANNTEEIERGQNEFYDTQTEYCEDCEQDQPHHVNVELKTESEKYGGNQPYQIFVCQICGDEREERVGFGD